jgi:hypothetical protein
MAKPAEATTNGFEAAVVQDLTNKIENCFDDLESERGSYMRRCRSIRERIRNIYDEGKARGVPKDEFRAFVKGRQALAKARKILEDLEQDQRETVELLAEAFGDAADLPLFASKIERTAAASQAKGDGAAAH